MSDHRSDATRLFSFLRRLAKGEGNLSKDEIHELSELILSMSGSNVSTEIASFKEVILSKFEALTARVDALAESSDAKFDILTARIDAQDSKINSTRWMIGILGGVITLIIAYGTFLAG